MHLIVALVLAGGFALGIAAGVMLATARHQLAEDRRLADEEELAEVEELYVAWAALRRGIGQPRVGGERLRR